MTGVPETGKPETHSSLTIDHSHASDGYIIVKAPKSSRSLKIAISFDGTAKIHYNLTITVPAIHRNASHSAE